MPILFGFVCIWFDSKRKMFYIGSHAGTLDDGYIASNKRCQRAVMARPETFKRKILAVIVGTRKQLLAEEERWLQMIKVEELGTKYYNLKRVAQGGNLMEAKTQAEIEEWRKKAEQNGGQVKLTRFLKSGEPIKLRNKPNHPLTGWKVRYA